MSPEALTKLEEINEKIAKRTLLSETDKALLNKIRAEIETWKIDNQKNILKEEEGLGKLRESAKDKITLYRGLKEWGQKKFSFDAYTDNKKVAKWYWEKIISQTVSPKKLADFSNPSDELLQIIKDNWKGAEWYDLERLRGVATAEKFSMGTNMYEIFDDANVREALKNKWYDYVKFNDFGKDFIPHATYFSLKSIDAHKISKLIWNSLENNYNWVKPNRLDGEKLSIKEAETLLTKSWKNLNERIMIGIDQAWNLVLEDGRHLLEAYRTLWKEIPESKLWFVNDKAKKLFGELYSK